MKLFTTVFFASVSAAVLDKQRDDIIGYVETFKKFEMRLSTALQSEIESWITEAGESVSSSELVSHQYVQEMLAAGKMLLFQVSENLNSPSALLRTRKNEEKDQDWKFRDYGCYCHPTQKLIKDANWSIPMGHPVDEIDSECRQLYHAHQCLKVDHGAECESTSHYSWDVVDGRPFCADAEGTCAGDLCRLDLEFTRKLIDFAYNWDSQYHKNFGFDRKENCRASSGRPSGSSNTSSDGRGFFSNVMNDSGSAILSEESSKLQCCGIGLKRKVFHIERQQCCGFETRDIGECL